MVKPIPVRRQWRAPKEIKPARKLQLTTLSYGYAQHFAWTYMKTFIAVVTLLGSTACHSADIANKPCQLQKLSILPADARNEIYAGMSGNIEVQFRNENAPAVTDVFPDSVVTIRDRRNGQSCEIKDGTGIWSGKSVYLDADKRVLVLNEYSGATDLLAFYRPT